MKKPKKKSIQINTTIDNGIELDADQLMMMMIRCENIMKLIENFVHTFRFQVHSERNHDPRICRLDS